MKTPTILIGLGSGREGGSRLNWTHSGFLEVENGKRTVETLSLAELKDRLPNLADLVAEILAEAVRSSAK